MYLFTIVTEALSQKLNQTIAGHRLTGMKEKITTPSYADDVTITLESEAQVQQAISTVEEFGKASGLKINEAKTKGIRHDMRKDPWTGPQTS